LVQPAICAEPVNEPQSREMEPGSKNTEGPPVKDMRYAKMYAYKKGNARQLDQTVRNYNC